jgi:gamma-aminobutyric acid type B receptor
MQVIKIAQPVFCCSFATSGALLCLSNALMVGPNTTVMCHLRPWVFNLTFDVMFGSLFMKTFRVYKIFGNKSLTKVKVSSIEIIRTYGMIVFVDATLLVLWIAFGDEGEDRGFKGMYSKSTQKNIDMAGTWTYDAAECNNDGSEMYEVLTIFFKVLLVAGGVKISWEVRNVPSKFSEGKYIGISVL